MARIEDDTGSGHQPGVDAFTILRVCALWVLASMVGAIACTRGADEEPARPSAGAARLLIQETDLGRQAQKLLANLKSDPYVYFRFINRPWARATCEALGDDLSSLPYVHLHGDAHVVQYAYTRTDHGLDDLDDSVGGPAVLDIVRFLGSIDLATRARGWTGEREEMFDEFFRAYRAALMDPDYQPPVPSYVSRMRKTLPEATPPEFLKWAESLITPVATMDDPGIEEGRRRLAEVVAAQRPELPSFYLEPKRFGWLQMGVGSARTPKLLLRCEGRTRADEDDFLLEARELSDLSDVPCVDAAQSETAARIVEGYGRIGRIHHDIVVVVPAPPSRVPGEREWWVRSWEPSYRELELDQLASPGELVEVIHDAAAQLGQGHAWTPTDDPAPPRRRNREWLDHSEARMRALAVQMAEDLREAWELFRGAKRQRPAD